MNKYTSKKRVLRAVVMTMCLVTYFYFVTTYVQLEGYTSFLFLFLTCFLLDFCVLKALKTRGLRKFFFEERGKNGNSN